MVTLLYVPQVAHAVISVKVMYRSTRRIDVPWISMNFYVIYWTSFFYLRADLTCVRASRSGTENMLLLL